MIEDILTSEGVYVFPKPVVTQEQIKKIIDLTENKLDPDDGSYKFGRAGRIGSVENWSGTVIHDVFNNPSIWDIAFSFMKKIPKELDILPMFDYTSQYEDSFLAPLRVITDKMNWILKNDEVGTLEDFFG